MTAAWEEQKHTARRMGEEAKTKLLVPLFLMLLVVIFLTRDFWLSLSWWVYLLAAGATFLLFAAVLEKKERL